MRVSSTWSVSVELFCGTAASRSRRSTGPASLGDVDDGSDEDEEGEEDGSARRTWRVRPPGEMLGRRSAAPGRACGSSAAENFTNQRVHIVSVHCTVFVCQVSMCQLNLLFVY